MVGLHGCWVGLTSIHGKRNRVLPRRTATIPEEVKAEAVKAEAVKAEAVKAICTVKAVQQAGPQGLGVQRACIKAMAVMDMMVSMIRPNKFRPRQLLLLLLQRSVLDRGTLPMLMVQTLTLVRPVARR